MMTGTRAVADGSRPPGRTAKTKLTEIVAVCTKCAKRQGLRPGSVRARLKKAGKEAGKEAGKQAARDGGTPPRRKLRIVATGCLGPCPKRAVAVATGASLAAGRIVLLDPAASPEDALAVVLEAGAAPRPSPNSAPIRL